MASFHIRPDFPERVAFVNGSYGVEAVRVRAVAGREIVYGVGSAMLDNSCCGAFGCAYVLIFGELVRHDSDGLTVREIADADFAEAVRKEVGACEGLSVVNFYVPPAPAASRDEA